MTSVDENATTHVVLIGVVGCSASGKTTVANRLAALLQSPLRPISMDAFFDANVCEALGTWEDPRCIRHREYLQFVSEIRRRLRQSDGTCASAARCLHGMVGAAEFLRSTPHEVVSSTKLDDVPSDDSLLAHEEEDARQQQRQSVEARPVNDACMRYAHDKTTYVVCEGFLLFADVAVGMLFDWFVFVHIDEETACLRRFFRTPRSHRQRNPRLHGCSERIKRMMQSRRDVLPRSAAADGAASDALPPSFFTQVLPTLRYVPPLPSMPGDYERFWLQKEFQLYPPPPPPPSSLTWTRGVDSDEVAAPFTWMEVKDLSYITQALESRRSAEGEEACTTTTTTSNNNNTTAANDASDASVLQRYFEFRYWFFYEVLYYYRQVYPLMEEHVAMASRRGVAEGDGAASCVYCISGGAGVSEAMIDAQLLSLLHRVVMQHVATAAVTTSASCSGGGGA